MERVMGQEGLDDGSAHRPVGYGPSLWRGGVYNAIGTWECEYNHFTMSSIFTYQASTGSLFQPTYIVIVIRLE